METDKTKAHYVCPGECGGVSDVPKNCDAEKCSFYGRPLQECRCVDGSHRQDIPTDAVTAGI